MAAGQHPAVTTSETRAPTRTVGARSHGPRWFWLVLGALLVPTACVVPVGAWFVGATIKASQGGATPTVAALDVLGALDEWTDEDLNSPKPYLGGQHERDMLNQLKTMRRQLASLQTGYQLEETNMKETRADNGVRVTIDVSILIDLPPAVRGTAPFVQSSAHPWTFMTRSVSWPRKGWEVVEFSATDICATYVSTC